MLPFLQASGFQQIADHTQTQGRSGMMAGTKGAFGLDEDGRPAGEIRRIRQPRRQDHKMVTTTHRREELTPGRQPVGLLQLGKSAFRSRDGLLQQLLQPFQKILLLAVDPEARLAGGQALLFPAKGHFQGQQAGGAVVITFRNNNFEAMDGFHAFCLARTPGPVKPAC